MALFHFGAIFCLLAMDSIRYVFFFFINVVIKLKLYTKIVWLILVFPFALDIWLFDILLLGFNGLSNNIHKYNYTTNWFFRFAVASFRGVLRHSLYDFSGHSVAHVSVLIKRYDIPISEPRQWWWQHDNVNRIFDQKKTPSKTAISKKKTVNFINFTTN